MGVCMGMEEARWRCDVLGSLWSCGGPWGELGVSWSQVASAQ